MDWEKAIRERYAKAIKTRENTLLGPVNYPTELTKSLPASLKEQDYGCMDPSKYLHLGDTVLDLGCGAGLFCLVASQLIGAKGKVIGIDMTDEMLFIARAAAAESCKKTKLRNVEFHKGRVQDLRLDMEKMEKRFTDQPVVSAADMERFEELVRSERAKSPMVMDSSVDTVVCNNVMNLVDHDFRASSLNEVFRVLNHRGRAIFCELAADQVVPKALQKESEHWTAGVSGAWTEAQWMRALEKAGFKRTTIVERGEKPWTTLSGVTFRPVLILASKGIGREDEIRVSERKTT